MATSNTPAESAPREALVQSVRRKGAHRAEILAEPLLKLVSPPDCKYSLAFAAFFKYASQKASAAELVYPRISEASCSLAGTGVRAVMNDMWFAPSIST